MLHLDKYQKDGTLVYNLPVTQENMVEEFFSSQSSDDELSVLAQAQMREGGLNVGSSNEDSPQIIRTLAIISYLKVTVLVIVGFIICKLLA